MALVFTPGQLTRRAELYYQLSHLTAAGLGLVQALKQLERNPPARSDRQPISQLLELIGHGYTLTESLEHLGGWLPEFDLALLRAGEHSGRLDACFKLLADYYSDRARLARQMITDLAYPVVLFHLAVLLFPFAQFFVSGNWRLYLAQTLGVFLPVYAVVFAMIYAAQSRHGESWRSLVERVLAPIPVLGAGRRCLALARLAAALEALISAGVTIIEAWELAAAASGSPLLRRTVLAWRSQVSAGQTPAEVVRASGRFPDLFTSQYTSGEISGKLDEVLRRLHGYYQEEGSRKLHAVATWTPRAFYLLVALIIAYRVVSFYMGYFNQLQNIMGP